MRELKLRAHVISKQYSVSQYSVICSLKADRSKLMSLTLTPLSGIPLIRHGDNLADLVVTVLLENRITLEDNDILVFAQKIVSKAEGRAVNLATVTPSQRAIDLARETEKDARVVELVLRESNEVLRT